MPRRQLTELTGQLKKARDLAKAQNRSRYRQTRVEGSQAVRELLTEYPQLVRDVYATEAVLADHPDIVELLRAQDPYTHILPDELSNRVAPSAQGLFAVIDLPAQTELSQLLAEEPNLLLCAAEVQDPGNLGTMIRSAAAAGASGVILGAGSVEIFSPKVIRASAGAIFHLPVCAGGEVLQIITQVQAAGIQVLAADGAGRYDLGQLLRATWQSSFTSADAAALAPDTTVELSKPTMWLIGNEARGLSAAQVSAADAPVRIPMQRATESLNAAMAATLCLYASAQAQHR
ncbi:MAG: RNA methyltransferase [Trueperella sp.]|nr:RNA methyltransferase [Trueperella sp.]